VLANNIRRDRGTLRSAWFFIRTIFQRTLSGVLALIICGAGVPSDAAHASSQIRITGDLYQLDGSLSAQCQQYIQGITSADLPASWDAIAVCRELSVAARDGGNAPDDCLYFTTVNLGVGLKEANAACAALVNPAQSSVASRPPIGTSGSSTQPGAIAANPPGSGAPAPWVDEVVSQYVASRVQITRQQPDEGDVSHLRACLNRNQALGRNGALGPCVRELAARAASPTAATPRVAAQPDAVVPVPPSFEFDDADCGPPSAEIPGPPPRLIVVGQRMSSSWLMCYIKRDFEGQTYHFRQWGAIRQATFQGYPVECGTPEADAAWGGRRTDGIIAEVEGTSQGGEQSLRFTYRIQLDGDYINNCRQQILASRGP
jgi:hypothetical protein